MEDWLGDLSLVLKILGFGQGLFLSIVLLKNKNIKPENYYLIFLLFSFSIIILYSIYKPSVYKDHLNLFDILSNTIVLAIGPSVYLYIKTKQNNVGIIKKSILHYFPFLLIFITDSVTFLFSQSEESFFNRNLFLIGPIIFYTSYPYYLFLSLKIINKVKSELENLKWMKTAIWVMHLPWLYIFILHLIKYIFGTPIPDFFKLNISLFFAFCTFYFSYIHSSGEIGFAKKNRYESSKLEESDLQLKITKIKKSIEENKLYLDQNLSLSQVSNITGISTREVSLTINQATRMSFNDFINSYRVEYFKKILEEPKSQTYTTLALAEKCGFKSSSTFYKAFKKKTGITPSEYKKTNKELQKPNRN